MTLIEAIKSGKRFKRPAFNRWLIAHPHGLFICQPDGVDIRDNTYTRDLLADDWITEESKKPKLKGWIRSCGADAEVYFLRLSSSPVGEDFIRAPWLDEPEDNEND